MQFLVVDRYRPFGGAYFFIVENIDNRSLRNVGSYLQSYSTSNTEEGNF